MTPAQRWMGQVASTGCVICRLRCCRGMVPGQVHHVAEGSGLRSDYATACLCEEHHDNHRTGSGFHGMGTERFCKIFRVPGESEYGLLVMQAEVIAKFGGRL